MRRGRWGLGIAGCLLGALLPALILFTEESGVTPPAPSPDLGAAPAGSFSPVLPAASPVSSAPEFAPTPLIDEDLFLLGASPTPCRATPIPGPTPRTSVVGRGEIIRYFENQQVVLFEGHARLEYKNMLLKADKITLFADRNEAFAEGNVEFYRGDDFLWTDKFRYDFLKEQGMLAPGTGYYRPWYGQAEKVLVDTLNNEVNFDHGYATTCDLEKPHYRIECSEVLFYPRDKVIGKNAVFYVYDVPIFYWPWYRRSLKDRCQGFFLYPGYRNSWGFYLLSGYHWCAPDISTTFHLDYRYRRGPAYGFDGRFYVGDEGRGDWHTYYLNDKRYEVDDEIKTAERYLAEVWYRHSFPWGIKGILAAHYFSDPTIQMDFFRNQYEADSQPQSTAWLGKITSDFTVNAQVIKRLNTFYKETEKLPELKLQVKQIDLWDSNFYYQGTTAYTSFRKMKENQTDPAYQSDRFDTFHQLSYSDKYFGWLMLEPYANIRETYYSRGPGITPVPTPSAGPTVGPTPEPVETPKPDDRTNIWREVWGGGLKVSTSIYGIFPAESELLEIHRLRHVIQPFAYYYYTYEPTVLPKQLYQFDSVDSIKRTDYTAVGIRNLLQTKRFKRQREYSWTMVDFLVKTPLYTYPDRDNKGRQFGDLFGELKLMPFADIGLDEIIYYDMYKEYARKNSLDIWIAEDDSWKLSAHYEINRDKKKDELAGSFYLRLSELWAFRVYARYDIRASELEEESLTIYRDLHCWDSRISYRRIEATNDNEVLLTLWIKAFPDTPLDLSN